MKTSKITQKYWMNIVRSWAEQRLTHPDYGGSPQLDEFNQVVDDLEDAALEVEKVKASITILIQQLENTLKTVDGVISEDVIEQVNKLFEHREIINDRA